MTVGTHNLVHKLCGFLFSDCHNIAKLLCSQSHHAFGGTFVEKRD